MIEGVILDIDGVLRRGREVIPGSVEAVNGMVAKGLSIVYLSNNSTRTREAFLDELMAMGYPSATMITSAYSTAVHLERTYGPSRCLVVGEIGLETELRRAGHTVIRAGEARGLGSISRTDWVGIDGDALGPADADIVVVVMDRTLTYTRLADAMLTIRNGATFVATNEDPSLPFEGGTAIPGAGTMVAALRRCTGVEPIVIGKPEVHSTRIALAEMGLDPSNVLVIGDRPDTDMAAGIKAGANVAMVLTGDVKDPGEVDFQVYPDLLALARDQGLM
jgi:4-nitrophenyl phosphatase